MFLGLGFWSLGITLYGVATGTSDRYAKREPVASTRTVVDLAADVDDRRGGATAGGRDA